MGVLRFALLFAFLSAMVRIDVFSIRSFARQIAMRNPAALDEMMGFVPALDDPELYDGDDGVIAADLYDGPDRWDHPADDGQYVLTESQVHLLWYYNEPHGRAANVPRSGDTDYVLLSEGWRADVPLWAIPAYYAQTQLLDLRSDFTYDYPDAMVGLQAHSRALSRRHDVEVRDFSASWRYPDPFYRPQSWFYDDFCDADLVIDTWVTPVAERLFHDLIYALRQRNYFPNWAQDAMPTDVVIMGRFRLMNAQRGVGSWSQQMVRNFEGSTLRPMWRDMQPEAYCDENMGQLTTYIPWGHDLWGETLAALLTHACVARHVLLYDPYVRDAPHALHPAQVILPVECVGELFVAADFAPVRLDEDRILLS